MALWYLGCTAFPVIEDGYASPVSRQIDGGGESGGTATHDQTIQDVSHDPTELHFRSCPERGPREQ